MVEKIKRILFHNMWELFEIWMSMSTASMDTAPPACLYQSLWQLLSQPSYFSGSPDEGHTFLPWFCLLSGHQKHWFWNSAGPRCQKSENWGWSSKECEVISLTSRQASSPQSLEPGRNAVAGQRDRKEGGIFSMSQDPTHRGPPFLPFLLLIISLFVFLFLVKWLIVLEALLKHAHFPF